MAMKGQVAKEEITAKLLELFNGSFKYDKEIRIPWVEDGEQIQIKCVLTAAKVPVSSETSTPELVVSATPAQTAALAQIEPTEEEKANLRKLLKSLC